MGACVPIASRDNAGAFGEPVPQPAEIYAALPEIYAALLTGGQDRHYAFGLAMALSENGVALDLIGSDETDSPELQSTPKLKFLNLRGNQRRGASLAEKVSRVLIYYARLIRYAFRAKPKCFHILWNNKFELFDRTLLMLYYKMLGKKVVFTAHNVNTASRDGHDTLANRLTLKFQYRLSDHIFVHTAKMKAELVDDFGVPDRNVTVIPYGINNAVPDTSLKSPEAKRRLGLKSTERAILFFGAIAPYKGLDLLVAAFDRLVEHAEYRLIIAGKPKGGCKKYLAEVQERIRRGAGQERILQKIEYIRDEDAETYFKAADLLVLPYTQIFQSGILFLAYSFGLPVVAADVGSFGKDVIEGQTGFVAKPGDPIDLAETIEKYFASNLFQDLAGTRQRIRSYARATHSWEAVGEMTRKVYARLLGDSH